MLTIHAGNMKLHPKLEKKKKKLLEKVIFYPYLQIAVKSIVFKPALNDWVQKMCERREKEKGKEEKEKEINGDLNLFLSKRAVFSYAQWSFLNLKSKLKISEYIVS